MLLFIAKLQLRFTNVTISMKCMSKNCTGIQVIENYNNKKL